MKTKKRFIAGATCSQCNEMDTLMLYLENGVEKVECVACHHVMAKPGEDVEQQARSNEQVIGVFKP